MRKLAASLYILTAQQERACLTDGEQLERPKRIELRFLFDQELILSGVVVVKKVLVTLNLADIMIKYVSKDTLQRHLSDAGILTRHTLSQPTYPDSSVHAITSSSHICSILFNFTDRERQFV